jgi:hypothetical protein
MTAYTPIEDVSALPQNINSGAKGWGFRMWSDKLDDEAPHRLILEMFASIYPEAGIKLPPYDRYEDYVETTATWNGGAVAIYYETILSYLWLWSSDRAAVSAFRAALLPFAK